MQRHDRLDGVQVLRAVAVLLVVFFHGAAAERATKPVPEVLWLNHFMYFGYGGVNLFFVISGFIMVYITQPHWGDRTQWAAFAGRRAIRIYPIYWLCWLATVLLWTYGPTLTSKPGMAARCHPTDTTQELLLSLLLLPQQTAHCFIPQAWSLNYEIYFYALFSIVLLIPRCFVRPFLGAWTLISLVFAFGPSSIANGAPHMWSVMNLHFLLGAWVALLVPAGQGMFARSAIGLGIFWCAASAFLNYTGAMSVDRITDRFLQFGVASALVLYGVVSLKDRMRSPQWAILIGDASYAIYLVHLTLFLTYRRVTYAVPHDALAHVIWLIGLCGTSIGFGIAVHLYVEKPLLRWMRSLSVRPYLTATRS